MTNAKAWFNIALRPQKPEGSLEQTAQDGHLDSHTAPELWGNDVLSTQLYNYIVHHTIHRIRTVSEGL